MRMQVLIAGVAGILISQPATAQYQPGYKPGAPEPKAADGTLGAAELFAVVTAAGAISRGAGTVSSTKFGAGQYQVIFNRNVTECVYVASVADLGNLIPPAGQIGVAPRAGSVNGVFIQTRNATGAPADLNFMLKVSCVR